MDSSATRRGEGRPPKLSLDAYEAALPDVLKKRARATIEETMEFLELNRKTVIKYRRELRARRTIVTKTFPTPVSDDPEPDVIARLARVVLAKLGPAARHLSREQLVQKIRDVIPVLGADVDIQRPARGRRRKRPTS